jgi:hypothetical protein
VVGSFSFALERLDSPRHSSHVAQLWSLGHIRTMIITRFIFCICFTMAFLVGGGSDQKLTPDPMAGWHTASHNPDQAIEKDYQAYIHTLSPDEQKFLAYVEVFEDGTGRYAVKITIGLNHTNWCHVLIYDKDDKRIKTVKYISGNSMS